MNQFTRWRKKWETLLLGTQWNPDGAYEKTAIASIETIAAQDIRNPIKEDDSICTDNISWVFFYLHSLAVAYRTPGTKQYNDPAIKLEILGQLEELQRTTYNKNSAPEIKENWWAVEIGIPLRVLNIFVLLYDDLPTGMLEEYTETMLHFKDEYMVSSRGMPETGANLLWKCQILLLIGILREDMQWIDWANEQIPTMLHDTKMGQRPGIGKIADDGFYPDGSFVQHYMFAYTGGYGKNFIGMLAYLLYAFDGEDCLRLTQENRNYIWDIIHRCYEPLIYNGRFMDIARGRELSRFYQQDNITGRHVIRYLAYLSQVMPQPQKDKTVAMLKEWLRQNDTGKMLLVDESPYAEHYLLPSMAQVLRAIEQSPTAPRGQLLAHYNFGPMCKTVHHGNGFAVAIGMYSKTIACYERLNTESTKLWHISDGFTYLYTSADPDQFNGDFYATADMQRLPGTTVDRSPTRYSDPYYSWYTPDARNVYAFAGGAAFARQGIAGLQYRGQGNGQERSLEVKKSWFFLGDEVVCLGSGITSPSGNPIETTVEQKRLLPGGTNAIVLDGKAATDGKHSAQWLHMAGNNGTGSDVGYFFPAATSVNLLREHRTGTWNTVKTNPNNQKGNDFATVWIGHGSCPQNADYAYVILPGASPEQTTAYADAPEISILENSQNAHAVQHSNGLLGVNFWNTTEYECAGIRSNTQASVLVSADEIAICDPTQTDATLEIQFNFAADVLAHQPEVEVLCTAPLAVRVNTTGKDGGSVTLAVQRK